MATTATIPITISPEADAFISGLGARPEFEAMLDHTRQAIADLRAIEVYLDDVPGTIPPGIVIVAHRGDPRTGDDPTNRNWGRWLVETFPPEVCEHFVLFSQWPTDGR